MKRGTLAVTLLTAVIGINSHPGLSQGIDRPVNFNPSMIVILRVRLSLAITRKLAHPPVVVVRHRKASFKTAGKA